MVIVLSSTSGQSLFFPKHATPPPSLPPPRHRVVGSCRSGCSHEAPTRPYHVRGGFLLSLPPPAATMAIVAPALTWPDRLLRSQNPNRPPSIPIAWLAYLPQGPSKPARVREEERERVRERGRRSWETTPPSSSSKRARGSGSPEIDFRH
jgi:hypothetical protein